jgi:hypothetical protein
VVVLRMLRVLSPKLATYSFVPSGLTATPLGVVPTLKVAVNVFDAVEMTLTVAAPEFVT